MYRDFELVQWNTYDSAITGSVHRPNDKSNTWVIVSHGFSGHRIGPGYLFVKLSKYLSKRNISSLRYDFRGAGESDGKFYDMTIQTMSADLSSAAQFIRANYQPSKIILLGHSLGGLVSALCARELNADGLILLSPAADTRSLVMRHKKLIEQGPNERGLYEIGPHELKRSFADTMYGIDPVQYIEHYLNPVVVIQGDNDETISMQESKSYITKAIETNHSDASFKCIQGADHNFTNASSIRKLFSTINTWLEERFL
ncbi:alpha/beta fold hydrolase [Chitinispirillales bacterium ANBcel5]|uniref:alpha/beta hydrolase n=1 Tax=Cellulosispirillum alkaliphilum TaxID=3039283 RepID=UPI002A4F5DE9|nr:alpha/beta fold hydrolase [Chitinispirillales bacterium ANBcel5]